MSGLTSNANLTGYKYGNGSTVGEQFPNVPIQAAPTGAQTVTLNLLSNTSTVYNPTVVPGTATISLNQIASTTTVYNPTVVQAGGSQTITLDLLSNTSTVYNPTVLPGAVTISLDQIVSTTTVYNPTVVQPGGAQTIALDLLASTTQVFNPIVSLISLVTDTSDILDKGLKKRRYKLTKLEEEEIALQLLQRRGKPKPQEIKQEIDWRQMISDAINGVTSIEELNAFDIPTEGITSPSATAALLAEIEKQKELKRVQLEIAQKEAELKAIELTAKLQEHEAKIVAAITEQQAKLEEAKRFQEQMLERYRIAQEQAQQEEMQAYLEAVQAEQQYLEFKRKRDNRIKSLKALMWLAKLDL